MKQSKNLHPKEKGNRTKVQNKNRRCNGIFNDALCCWWEIGRRRYLTVEYKQNPGKDNPSINQVIQDKLACSNWIEGDCSLSFSFHNKIFSFLHFSQQRTSLLLWHESLRTISVFDEYYAIIVKSQKKAQVPTSINMIICLKVLSFALDIEPFSDHFFGPWELHQNTANTQERKTNQLTLTTSKSFCFFPTNLSTENQKQRKRKEKK